MHDAQHQFNHSIQMKASCTNVFQEHLMYNKCLRVELQGKYTNFRLIIKNKLKITFPNITPKMLLHSINWIIFHQFEVISSKQHHISKYMKCSWTTVRWRTVSSSLVTLLALTTFEEWGSSLEHCAQCHWMHWLRPVLRSSKTGNRKTPSRPDVFQPPFTLISINLE